MDPPGWRPPRREPTQEEVQAELDKIRLEIDRIRQIIRELERFLQKLLREGKNPILIREVLAYWEEELRGALRREENLLRPWMGVAPPPPPPWWWGVVAVVVTAATTLGVVYLIREGYLPDPSTLVTGLLERTFDAVQEGRLTPEQFREFLERFRRGE